MENGDYLRLFLLEIPAWCALSLSAPPCMQPCLWSLILYFPHKDPLKCPSCSNPRFLVEQPSILCPPSQLENQGDPSYFKSPSSQSLSYWNCVYFLMVTMSTVGYGDIVCVTAAGRGFQVLFLLVGLVSILLTLWLSYPPTCYNVAIEESCAKQAKQIESCNTKSTQDLYLVAVGTKK